MYECVGLTSGSSVLHSVLWELSDGDSLRLNVVDDSWSSYSGSISIPLFLHSSPEVCPPCNLSRSSLSSQSLASLCSSSAPAGERWVQFERSTTCSGIISVMLDVCTLYKLWLSCCDLYTTHCKRLWINSLVSQTNTKPNNSIRLVSAHWHIFITTLTSAYIDLATICVVYA